MLYFRRKLRFLYLVQRWKLEGSDMQVKKQEARSPKVGWCLLTKVIISIRLFFAPAMSTWVVRWLEVIWLDVIEITWTDGALMLESLWCIFANSLTSSQSYVSFLQMKTGLKLFQMNFWLLCHKKSNTFDKNLLST